MWPPASCCSFIGFVSGFVLEVPWWVIWEEKLSLMGGFFDGSIDGCWTCRLAGRHQLLCDARRQKQRMCAPIFRGGLTRILLSDSRYARDDDIIPAQLETSLSTCVHFRHPWCHALIEREWWHRWRGMARSTYLKVFPTPSHVPTKMNSPKQSKSKPNNTFTPRTCLACGFECDIMFDQLVFSPTINMDVINQQTRRKILGSMDSADTSRFWCFSLSLLVLPEEIHVKQKENFG